MEVERNFPKSAAPQQLMDLTKQVITLLLKENADYDTEEGWIIKQIATSYAFDKAQCIELQELIDECNVQRARNRLQEQLVRVTELQRRRFQPWK